MLHLAEAPHFTVRTVRAPRSEVRVRMPDGGLLSPQAVLGLSLAQSLATFGIPLRSERGLPESHVRIASAWAARLPAPTDDERRGLQQITGAGPTSRLASQIIMTPALDGLEIEIDANSLAPQGWAAG